MDDIIEALIMALNGPGAAGAAGLGMAWLFLRHAGAKDKLSYDATTTKDKLHHELLRDLFDRVFTRRRRNDDDEKR